MKIRKTETTIGFTPTDTTVEVLVGDFMEWKTKHGIMFWDTIPRLLNLSGYWGDVCVLDLAKMSDEQRTALVDAARARTQTVVTEFEV